MFFYFELENLVLRARSETVGFAWQVSPRGVLEYRSNGVMRSDLEVIGLSKKKIVELQRFFLSSTRTVASL